MRLSVLGNLNEVRHLEVRFSGWRRSDHKGLVHDLGVLGELVGLRVHADRLNAEAMSGSSDAACDFATIRDQKLVEHF